MSIKSRITEQRKRGYERVMRAIGLHYQFSILPKWIKEQFYKHVSDEPLVLLSEAVSKQPNAQEIQDALNNSLCGLKIRLKDIQEEISVSDYCNYFSSALLGFKSDFSFSFRTTPKDINTVTAVLAECSERTIYIFHDNLLEFFNLVFRELNLSLSTFIVFNEHLFSISLTRSDCCLRFMINYHEPQKKYFAINNKKRPAYRFGSCYGYELEWLNMDGSSIGREHGKKFPIYVQEHVVKRILERIPLPEQKPKLLDDMWSSLRSNKPSKTYSYDENECCMIEYTLFYCKVGYFTAIILTDAILITTFLFLTMEGTPEHKKLKEKLRLARKDIERLDLDKLEVWLCSDIEYDGKLYDIFTECGFGDLFKLIDKKKKGDMAISRAGSIREYLGLDDIKDKGLEEVM